MVSKDVIKDMDLARNILSKNDYSIVVVKNGEILTKIKGDGIRPIIKAIEKLEDSIHDSIIGDRILGKASALLCRYAKVKGVYSPQATKTAIAILIMAGVQSQIDELIPYIKNKSGNDFCPFEKILSNVESPEDAYNILKNKI
jgi:hypothetical protein